jgi:hypothetical protein
MRTESDPLPPDSKPSDVDDSTGTADAAPQTAALADLLVGSLGEHDVDRTLSSLERAMAAVVVERAGIRVPNNSAELTTIQEWLTWATTQRG